MEQTVNKDASSLSSSHRFKCEGSEFDSNGKSSKRQKINYDYEDDSFNDYEDDEDDDESEDDEDSSEQSIGTYNMIGASSSGHFEHNFANYSGFGFDSNGVNVNCVDYSRSSKNPYSLSSGSTSSDSSVCSSSKQKIADSKSPIKESNSAKKPSKKSTAIQLKSEPIIAADLKLKAFDLNRKGVESKPQKAALNKNKSSSALSTTVTKSDSVTVKNGIESENETNKTNKRKNSTVSCKSPIDQAIKASESATNLVQKTTKTTTSKKSTDLNNNTAKSQPKSKKNTKTSVNSTSIPLVDSNESNILNGITQSK